MYLLFNFFLIPHFLLLPTNPLAHNWELSLHFLLACHSKLLFCPFQRHNTGIELGISLPASCSVQFLFHWQASYSSIYCFTSFVTPGHQKFLVTSSTVFYYLPWPPTSVSWYSLIISALSVTNFIWPYLHQFFNNSHSLNGYGKPLKRPFDQYQSRLEAISNGWDIRQINW